LLTAARLAISLSLHFAHSSSFNSRSTASTLRVVFGLPLRQTEGFLDSLLSLMGLDLKAPDHTTLSRRNRIVKLPPPSRAHEGPIHQIVDSTGLISIGSVASSFGGRQDSACRRN
jgi:hypothetical protein